MIHAVYPRAEEATLVPDRGDDDFVLPPPVERVERDAEGNTSSPSLHGAGYGRRWDGGIALPNISRLRHRERTGSFGAPEAHRDMRHGPRCLRRPGGLFTYAVRTLRVT